MRRVAALATLAAASVGLQFEPAFDAYGAPTLGPGSRACVKR